jgi:hypothetical protein
MTPVDRHHGWLLAGVRARMPVTALVLAVTVLLALAGQGARATVLPAANREPPDVVGMALPEAQTVIQQQRYPRFTPTIRVAPELPPQVPPEAARVVEQRVVQYLEDSSETDLAAIIDLTAGSVVADLVGRTRDEAQQLVDALGLTLKATGTGRVDRQDPAPGTLVPFGTNVQAVLVPPPPAVTPTLPTPSAVLPEAPTPAVTDPEPQPVDSEPASWVGWPVGAVLVLLGLLGVWTVRSMRSRRPPRDPPAPPEVRVEPRPDPAPVVWVHPQAADPELLVQVVPGPDLGHLTLTEESR